VEGNRNDVTFYPDKRRLSTSQMARVSQEKGEPAAGTDGKRL